MTDDTTSPKHHNVYSTPQTTSFHSKNSFLHLKFWKFKRKKKAYKVKELIQKINDLAVQRETQIKHKQNYGCIESRCLRAFYDGYKLHTASQL